jgi:hypothetical protein
VGNKKGKEGKNNKKELFAFLALFALFVSIFVRAGGSDFEVGSE